MPYLLYDVYRDYYIQRAKIAAYIPICVICYAIRNDEAVPKEAMPLMWRKGCAQGGMPAVQRAQHGLV